MTVTQRQCDFWEIFGHALDKFCETAPCKRAQLSGLGHTAWNAPIQSLRNFKLKGNKYSIENYFLLFCKKEPWFWTNVYYSKWLFPVWTGFCHILKFRYINDPWLNNFPLDELDSISKIHKRSNIKMRARLLIQLCLGYQVIRTKTLLHFILPAIS